VPAWNLGNWLGWSTWVVVWEISRGLGNGLGTYTGDRDGGHHSWWGGLAGQRDCSTIASEDPNWTPKSGGVVRPGGGRVHGVVGVVGLGHHGLVEPLVVGEGPLQLLFLGWPHGDGVVGVLLHMVLVHVLGLFQGQGLGLCLSNSFGGCRVREVGQLGEHLLLGGGAELVVVSPSGAHMRVVGGGVHGLGWHLVLCFGLCRIGRWLVRMLLDGGGAELVVVIPEHGLCHIGHGLIRMLKLSVVHGYHRPLGSHVHVCGHVGGHPGRLLLLEGVVGRGRDGVLVERGLHRHHR